MQREDVRCEDVRCEDVGCEDVGCEDVIKTYYLSSFFWKNPTLFFFSGQFGDFFPDSCSLKFEAFRSRNLDFHVVFARFCNSYACGVGGVGGLGV